MFYDQWPIENVKLQLSLPAFHPLLFVHNGKITFVYLSFGSDDKVLQIHCLDRNYQLVLKLHLGKYFFRVFGLL